MKNFLFSRLSISLIGIPTLLYIISKGNFLYFSFLFTVISLSLLELFNFEKILSSWKISIVGILLSLGICLGYAQVFLPNEFLPFIDIKIIFSINISLLILYFISEVVSVNDKKFQKISMLILGVVYIPLLLGAAIAIRGFDELQGSRFTLLLFITVWTTDSFAYIIGNNFGKHKFIEKISPNKTTEGFIGGFFGALLCVYLMNYFDFINFELSNFHLLSIAIIIGIFGQLGDFIESMIKREFDIKDSGKILMGHGGFLDRFDSLIVSSPLILIFIFYIT